MKYSKKVLTGIATGIAVAISHITDNAALGDAVLMIGLTIIAGFASSDFGKEAKRIEKETE